MQGLVKLKITTSCHHLQYGGKEKYDRKIVLDTERKLFQKGGHVQGDRLHK